MLDGMSSREFAEWQAYYLLEPFGREWDQTAYLCTMIGNGNGGKKGGKPFVPDDFMPVKPILAARVRPQSSEQMRAVLSAMAKK